MSYLCQKCEKTWGSPSSFQTCRVNYTDFEKLSHIIEHGLEGFIAKNIEGESTEANNLSHIL